MIQIDGEHLNIDQVVAVALSNEPVELSLQGCENIARSHEVLESILAADNPVYGINTGFGIFADKRIPRQDSARLSRNLILSHAVGRGRAIRKEVTRAAMLIRANTLAKGFSGVRLEVVQTLLDMLNKGVTPVVPEQGSLGSSGDLGPLSHMTLVFSTDENDRIEESGWADFQGTVLRGNEAMRLAGIDRIILGPKEGLALNNGATFCAAFGSIAVFDAEYLCQLANRSVGMSFEALLGCSAALDPRVHEVRGHHGQIESAAAIKSFTAGSSLMDSTRRVQDAYSLRCAPQVHGAVMDTVDYVKSIVTREINAVTDNPILFSPSSAISGGNFHGEPVGLVMDFLGIAMAELGAISERRTFRLIDGKLNENLPPMLVDNLEAAGLNSGVMMPHYTAASLVLENQTLAHPDSVHSLPTSGSQEDHNANAMTAARHTDSIIDNCRQILAIELFTAARALDLRLKMMPGNRPGEGSVALHKVIRENIPYHADDKLWGNEIDKIYQLVCEQKL